MSSLPSDDHLHLINQNFPDPLEISSDICWPSIEDYFNPDARFNLEMFQDYENALLHATDSNKTGNNNNLNFNVLVGKESSVMAMSGIQENNNQLTLSNNFQVSDDLLPELRERTESMIVIEQENSLAGKVTSDEESNAVPDEPEKSSVATKFNNKGKGSRSKKAVMKTKEIKHRFRRLLTEKMAVRSSEEEGPTSKKEEHNAKEKVRRMKLNASYLALGSLLPNSRRSKKRWTAPVIIDKVVEYIPVIESEIEELRLKKNSIASKIEEKAQLVNDDQGATVSVHEIKEGEIIMQICMQTNIDKGLSFVMQNLEAQGITILSASSINICDDTISYHLHLQMNGNPLVADYILAFRKKIISLLN
ncbi:uncharacterized protein LOC126661183 isoform X2 [Mercurialis annua]|uniref:uncharacterized protein LOC126661183 isoform X2 n=1 Tax=Mercurialis annua TaxID=3986 RepID=UPI002160619A|nr:uncharacterized protein LOC126661183 isoform X2 [Mercurialis annua]